MTSTTVKVTPLRAYALWLGPQGLADMYVATFEEVEEVFRACHEGREHPFDPLGDHEHHSDHPFTWSSDEARPADVEPSQMLSWMCARVVTDDAFRTAATVGATIREEGDSVYYDLTPEQKATNDAAVDELMRGHCDCQFERALVWGDEG